MSNLRNSYVVGRRGPDRPLHTYKVPGKNSLHKGFEKILTKHFTWKGVGPMPAEEQRKLREIVKTAHRQGQRVRFWATPDNPSVARDTLWSELLSAGVDLINTDDLEGLQQFLLANRTN